MNREDCEKLIKYFEVDHCAVSPFEWCNHLKFAIAGWKRCERPAVSPVVVPPLTGNAPDDEAV